MKKTLVRRMPCIIRFTRRRWHHRVALIILLDGVLFEFGLGIRGTEQLQRQVGSREEGKSSLVLWVARLMHITVRIGYALRRLLRPFAS